MGLKKVREFLSQLNEDAASSAAWEGLGKELDGSKVTAKVSAALVEARQRHASFGEWKAAAGLLSLQLEYQKATDAVVLLMELARIYQAELMEEGRALEAFEQVLKIEPEDDIVLAAVAESRQRASSWQAMRSSYAEEAAGASDQVYRAAMLMRAAEMAWRFGGEERQLDQLRTELAEAVVADPCNRDAHRLQELVLQELGEAAALDQALSTWAEGPGEASDRSAAAVRLGRRCLAAADTEAAVSAFELALNILPTQTEAVRCLVQYYSEAEHWDALVGVYERELAAHGQDRLERVGDMLQIAMLHYRKRNAPADAVGWFERIAALEPANAATLDFFREYYVESEQESALLKALQAAQRVMSTGEEKAALTAEIAKLAEGQEDAQKAIEQYKSLLRHNPEDAPARDALKSLYRKTQAFNQLVELLQHELERLPPDSVQERLALLREVCQVYRTEAPNDMSLVSALNQVLRVDDSEQAAVRELIGLYERLERWRDLLTNQLRLAELSTDAAEKGELYRAAGRRWLEQFSNVQNATAAFEALLQVAPNDEEARTTLSGLYKKRRAWPALYQLLEQELETLSGVERCAVMKEMASLAADRLGNGARAAELYKEILEEEPSNLEIVDALERQAERLKNWGTLADALERRVELNNEPNAQVVVLQKLGAVYGDQLNNLAKATSAWSRILELQPGHARAVRVLRDAYLANGDYEALEELYGGQEDYEGLAEVLGSTADRTSDLRSKIDLSYRAARVYEDKLGKPERAFRSYERILAADPLDVRAAKALIPLYEADEKWARLLALYELLLGEAVDKEETVDIYRKLAHIAAHRLSDRAAAASYARKAYEADPERDDCLEALEEACAAAADWLPYVEALESRLELHRASVAPPPKGGKRKRRKGVKAQDNPKPVGEDALTAPTVRRLELKLAQNYDQRLGRPDDAIAVYKRLLEAQPENQPAGEEMERLLRREKRYDELRWLMGLRVENAVSDEQSLELMMGWAHVEEETLGDAERATELYRRILEQTPDNREALTETARLLLSQGAAAKAVEVLSAHRDLEQGNERAHLEVQLAEAHLDKLDQPQESLEAAVRTIELEHETERAVAVLQRLVAIEGTQRRASEVLAEVYRRQGDSRQEADSLMALLGVETDTDRRLELYIRAVGVYEQMDSFSAAFEVMLKACREFPQQLPFWERASVLSVHASRPTEMAEAYREVLQASLPLDVQRHICERAALHHEEQLGDPVGATPYLEKVLELEPGNPDAFNQLKQVLTSNSKWGELRSLYEKTAAATSSPELKVELLAEVAMVCEEFMEDPKAALGYYEQIILVDPDQLAALKALDRLYQARGMAEKLEPLLCHLLTLEFEPKASIELRLRIAGLQLDELHHPADALEQVEAVLEQEVGDGTARRYAERILEIGSLRGRAAALLQAVYEARDEVRDLARITEIRLDVLRQEVVPSAERQSQERELLKRLAELRDGRLRDDAGALDTLCEYVPLAPEDLEARQRLLEIAERLGAEARVAAALLTAAEACDDEELRGSIWLQAAGLWNNAKELESARETFLRVLELGFPHLSRPAARALELIFEEQGDASSLVSNLKVQLELTDDVEAMLQLWGRVARLSESRLEDLEGAIEAWRTRLELEPGDSDALGALDRLYESTQQWEALVDILQRRRQASEEPGASRDYFRRGGLLLAEKLGRLGDAIETFRSLVLEHGPDGESLTQLERWLFEEKRFEELEETYLQHLDTVDETPERLPLLVALGQLRRQLGNEAGALVTFREVVALEPEQPDVRQALDEQMRAGPEEVQREAAEVLRPLFEAEGRHDRLVSVLEVLIQTADGPDSKLDFLRVAATVAEQHLAAPERAYDFLAAGVSEAAGQVEVGAWLEELERLAETTGKRAEQVALLRDIVEELFDGELQLSVLLKIAFLAQGALQDSELALTYYERALELNPVSDEALRALDTLYAEAERYSDLLQVQERRAELAATPEEAREFNLRRGHLLESKLKDPERAIAIFEAVLDGVWDERAAEALLELYQSQNRWEALCDLYRRQAELPGANKADVHVKTALVVRKQLDDIYRAFDELEAALALESLHEGAIEAVEQLMTADDVVAEHHARAASMLEPIYLARSDYALVLKTLQARLEYADLQEERRALLLRMAKIYEEQQEDYSSAFETVATLLLEMPEQVHTSIGELERLARVADKGKRLVEVYVRLVGEAVTDDDESIGLVVRTAELCRELGDAESSLGYYQRALRFNPESDELFDAVDQLLIQLQRPQARVELYREGLDFRFEPAARLRLLKTIAELQAGPLGSKDDAILTYVEALEVDSEDAISLDTLSRLYFETSRFEELYELVQGRAEAAPDPTRASRHRLALAKLCKNELGDSTRAISQLEEIVAVEPEHADALAELEAFRSDPEQCRRVVDILLPIYERNGDWRRVIKLNEDRFRLAELEADKVQVLRETATLWESRGGDPGRAFEGLSQAVRLDPEDDEVRQEYQRLAELTHGWDALAELYAEILQQNPELLAARDVWATLARCHDEFRDDPRAALLAYTQLHALDDTELGTVERMEFLATLLSDWESLDHVLVAKAELVVEDEERASLWRRVGEGRRDMLERPKEAVEAYERALEFEPDSLMTTDCLVELYEGGRNPERLAELYRQRVELLPAEESEQRYETLLVAAQLQREHFEDRFVAIDLLGEALVNQPGALRALEMLGGLYREGEMWPELLENLTQQAALSEDSESRAKLNRQRGQVLAEKLESFDEALEAYQAVLAESASDVEAQQRVREVGEAHEELRERVAAILLPAFQQTGAHEELVGILELRLSAESGPVERAQTLRAMARTLESELRDPSRTHAVLLRAMAEMPEDDSIHVELERLSSDLGAWEAYANGVLERARSTFDAELARDLFTRLGGIEEGKLGRPGNAIDAYVQAVEQVGDESELLELLDRLYTQEERWPELQDILERRSSIVDGPGQQALLHCRLGQLQLTHSREEGAALASLRTALELDPSLEEASTVLEKLLDERDLFQEASDALEDAYRSRSDVQRLTALCERRVECADSPGERLEMRKSLARVLEEEMANMPSAQRVLEQALIEEPSDGSLLLEVERMAQVTGDWRSAAEALSKAVSQHEELSAEDGRGLCVRLAGWYSDNTEDSQAAEQALERALTYDETAEDVLLQLEDLQSMPGRELARVETLRRRARLQYDEQQRERLYQVAVGLVGDDRNLEEELIRELLNEDEANLWALTRLSDLRVSQEDFHEAFGLLLRRADLTLDGEQALQLRHQAAQIARDRLNQNDKAVELLEQVFEQEPNDQRAIAGLRELYHKLERFREEARLLERLIEVAESPEERCSLRLELARQQCSQFQDNDAAIELLRDVLIEQPNNPEAVGLLDELYEATSRYGELAELIDRQVGDAQEIGDAAAARGFQLRLAEIYEERLRDTDAAVDAYHRVIDDEPQNDHALAALVRLYSQQGNLLDAGEMLGRRVEVAEGEQKRELLEQLAALYEKADEPVRMGEVLEMLLAEEPTDTATRERLQTLYAGQLEWSRVGELIAGAADTETDAERKVEHLKRAAEVFSQQAGDPDRSLELLQAAVGVAPEDRALLLQLCDAYAEGGRFVESIEALQQIVESYGGRRSKDLAEIHRRLASAYEAQGELDQAIAELDRAFRIEPGNIEVLKALGQLALETEELKRAQQMFRALLLQKLSPDGPITKAEVFHQLAIVHHRMDETPRAIQMLERALQTDPDLSVAEEFLAELR